MLTLMQCLLQKALGATVVSRGLGSLICQSQPTSTGLRWHVAISGSHPVQNQSPDQSEGQCVNVVLTWLLSLCDLCLPVAQIQCKQQSTNKCKYLKVSLKVPGLGNAWTGGECSQDKRTGGAGSHIPLVPISFVWLYNWAMLAICYQQLFLELSSICFMCWIALTGKQVSWQNMTTLEESILPKFQTLSKNKVKNDVSLAESHYRFISGDRSNETKLFFSWNMEWFSSTVSDPLLEFEA